ncbi:MAG: hypothetical protein H0U66_09885 [Gemmatimonadaceae bacterium]|nr:hypothetical protein [Gemmatimonadaceae bacterium]
MIRTTRSLIALSMLCATFACSKSADSRASGAAAAPSAPAASRHASFASGGAKACDKYLTADVLRKVLGSDVDERKELSAQSCTVRNTSTGGDLTITLKEITPGSFHAFRDYLSDVQPLPGVGDSAISSVAPTVTAIKGTMGCDFDASKGSAPGALGGMDRAKALGELCNRIFADAK